MVILIFEDLYLYPTSGAKENKNASLAELLRERGHSVVMFDGRHRDGKPIVDPKQAAGIVYQQICEMEIQGFILDLSFSGDKRYGEKFWNELRRIGLPLRHKAVVASQFLDEPRDVLGARMGIPAAFFFDRNITRIKDIAKEFDKFLAAPTNLVATPGNGQIVLAWDPSADASGYTVLRSASNGVGYSVVQSGVKSATFTDSKVVGGSSYFYVVQAVDGSARSAYSNQASGTVK